jgi:hypothetical protein
MLNRSIEQPPGSVQTNRMESTGSHEATFRHHLLVCIGTALSICAAVELTCYFLGIAPLFTSNLPLNEKMRFIREHRLSAAPLGVVSGASVALNDIDSDLLEDQEGHPFINLGAQGISVPTAERVYKNLAALYPVREVIFAADPLEMRDAYRSNVELPDAVFRRYVLGRMTMAEEFTYRDLTGLMSYWRNWHDYHSRTVPSSMVFSRTGSVPLDISRDTADPGAWSGDAIVPDIACLHCVDDFAGFCSDVRADGRPFTVVIGPIRPEVLARMPSVRAVDADRRARIRTVVKACGATLFDITEYATLDDSCFANSVHLNGHGMSAMTEQFLRFRRGEKMAQRMPLPCSDVHLVARGSSGRHAQSSRPDSE